MSNWFEDLMQRSERKPTKHLHPRLVAFYWDGGAPKAHEIREISHSGLYLVTDARWYTGTIVTMTLQRTEKDDTGSPKSIAVQARVLCAEDDGVSLSFVFLNQEDRRKVKNLVADGVEIADRSTLHQFLMPIWSNQGQSLMEYILLLPIVFLLAVNMVNFGAFFFAWITVANAARTAADYGILGGASVNAPYLPTAAQINAILTREVSSLPNNPSLVVNICENSNTTIKTLSGSCTSVPAPDPELGSYVETWMDVTYTYKPVIPGFNFPALHVYGTLPPTPIHSRAVMRLIQ